MLTSFILTYFLLEREVWPADPSAKLLLKIVQLRFHGESKRLLCYPCWFIWCPLIADPHIYYTDYASACLYRFFMSGTLPTHFAATQNKDFEKGILIGPVLAKWFSKIMFMCSSQIISTVFWEIDLVNVTQYWFSWKSHARLAFLHVNIAHRILVIIMLSLTRWLFYLFLNSPHWILTLEQPTMSRLELYLHLF